MTTIAAVGDVHLDEDAAGRLRPALGHIGDTADVLLLAGDLTRHGTVGEARVVAKEFGGLDVPVVAVLGNHDYHCDEVDEVTSVLADAGIHVLEGDGMVLDLGECTFGVAGVKGFGGGFEGKCGTAFGEPEMKSFIGHTVAAADRLKAALSALDCDVRVALTHYAPVPETVAGEPPEIFPFLGAYQLGNAIDCCDTALAVHGHAHFGSERGQTPGGVPVRNVAQPVINGAYARYRLPTS